MSTCDFTQREVRFAEVMDRLKQILAVTTDKEVAEALGMKGPAFSNRKKLASLPYEEIDALANRRALSLDLILQPRAARGQNQSQGRQLIENIDASFSEPRAAGSGVSEHPTGYTGGFDENALHRAFLALAAVEAETGLRGSSEERWRALVRLYEREVDGGKA